ncbi:hypothetical protein PO909_031139, partial [Leuciscus waleckii]
QPFTSEKHVVEGRNVTLSCNYSTTGVTVNSLQWYRQNIRTKPEILLLVTEYLSKSEPGLRLYSKATKEIKRVDLEISSAEVSDSAVYYCALEPTVTGNTTTLYKNLVLYLQYITHSHPWIFTRSVSTHTMILHSVILFSALVCASNGDTITPDKTQEFAAEGSSVKLSCNYSSAWSLLWYRQYPGSAPEFLVLILDSAKDVKTSDVGQRFTTKIRKDNQNRVDLEISSAEVSDSAVYYCALTPTVTGNTRTLYKNLLALVKKKVYFIVFEIYSIFQ